MTTSLPSYELRPFNADTFELTREEWLSGADSSGASSLPYEKTLEWAAKRMKYDEPHQGDSLAYGIFPTDNGGGAVAIADIVYTARPGPDVGWLKMLEVSLSPTIDPSVQQLQSVISMVVGVYLAAITGTLRLTGTHRSRVVKLYGRNENLLTFLTALSTQLTSELQQLGLDGLSVRMEGRWLVIGAKN